MIDAQCVVCGEETKGVPGFLQYTLCYNCIVIKKIRILWVGAKPKNIKEVK